MKQTILAREVKKACAALGVAAVAAGGVALASGPNTDAGRYLRGDFHNHTTCSDGQISVQKLVNKSVDEYGLDWFILADHGGGGTRNCSLVEDATVFTPPEYPFVPGQGPGTSWNASIGNDRLIGDAKAAGGMFRWQAIQEIYYPLLEKMARLKNKPIFVGIEGVTPGHEHTNVAVVTNQLPAIGVGDANALAQFEYCFDRAASDTSRGGPGNNWTCAVPGSPLNADLQPTSLALRNFDGKNYNSGTLGHLKALEGLKWLSAFHPDTSYFIPAHIERAGAFNPTASRGFNVEHLRNFNNTAPRIAFGMEGGPGHQADRNRSYGSGAVGGGTYGGAGFYTAQVGGVWDALLGEGRNWWIYNNSDYHNRGSFGPDEPFSTFDQAPGEFNDTYLLTRSGGGVPTPKNIVDALRSGNAYYVNGQLIDKFKFVVCRAAGAPSIDAIAAAAEAGTGFFHTACAQQGEKLVVTSPGEELLVVAVLRDPEGTNRSPFSFPNPSLLQVGITQPLNASVLHHVDLIGGRVTGYVDPTDTARYAGGINTPAATNPTTSILATFNDTNWTALPGGWKRMVFRLANVRDSQYVRMRGTNIPQGTPNETDSVGNPLIDTLANNVVCADAACPAHLPIRTTGGRTLDFDVEAWTDLWFYSNPVYVEVLGSTPIRGVQNARGDVNGDGRVDSRDVQLITAARGQTALPGDSRDVDGDGRLTVADARTAATLCTSARCATT